MKTILTSQKNQIYKLRIDQSGIPNKEKPVVARMLLHEGTGCWVVEDARLGWNLSVSPYFCVAAEYYQASFRAENEDNVQIIRGLLRDFSEVKDESDPDANAIIFEWCTYNGITPGKTGIEVSGYQSQIPVFQLPIFHNKKDALKIIESIAEFWKQSQINEDDPNAALLAGRVKIENKLYQPLENLVQFEVWSKNVCATPPPPCP